MAEEKEKPLTREDVLRLIELEKYSYPRVLNLTRCRFEEAVNLSNLDLSGIILNDAWLFRANFNGSNLDRARMQNAYLGYATFNPIESRIASLQSVDLRGANLHNAEFREADLSGAQFQEEPVQLLPASLENTDFRGANLFRANFKGCYFYGTKLEGAFIRGADILEAHLDEADWGSYIIGEESKKEEWYFAESIYRRLKQWYTNAGMYDIAGEFFFREMTAQRKGIRWWPHPTQRKRINWWIHPRHRAWSRCVSLICGYGERPFRVVASGAVVVFSLAAVYYLFGGLTLPYSLYYSAVSFTALGYGKWVDIIPQGWVQAFGAAESFIGVFMIALFLITFTRKMRR